MLATRQAPAVMVRDHGIGGQHRVNGQGHMPAGTVLPIPDGSQPPAAALPSRDIAASSYAEERGDTPAGFPDYSPRIREIPTSERPRERLHKYGPSALSTAELIAIIWRSGTKGQNVLNLASHALARFGGLAVLARASVEELAQMPGIGPAKAIELLAAFELGRRLLTMQPEERPTVQSPEDIVNLLAPEMSAFEQEHLRVVLLDAKHRISAIREVYIGSLNASPVRVSELFREAVRQASAAIVIVHNHPSGDPTPSPEDIQVTRDARRAGEILDIELLDHLILGQQRFVSIKESTSVFTRPPDHGSPCLHSPVMPVQVVSR